MLILDDRTNLTQSAVLTGASVATGGNGGSGAVGGGLRGTASAVADLIGTGAVTAAATGTAGAAGTGATDGSADATANATSTGLAKSATTNATATAGHAPGSGRGGFATAIATATTASGQQATALATGAGAAGIANAIAITAGSIFTNVSAVASGVVGGTTMVKGSANIGGPSVALDYSGLNTYGFVSALPNSAFVTQAFAEHDNVAAAFSGASATVLGAGAQGAFYSTGSAGPHHYVSTLDWTFDTTKLSGHLLVGLLDNASFGSGLQQLEFSIREDGTVVFDQIFSDLTSAEGFFNDTAIDLGPLALAASFDLAFGFDLLGTAAGNGYGADFLFGASSSVPIPLPPGGGPGGSTVPEPGTLALVGSGIALLSAMRRRARAG
jgi:hypothetical protein